MLIRVSSGQSVVWPVGYFPLSALLISSGPMSGWWHPPALGPSTGTPLRPRPSPWTSMDFFVHINKIEIQSTLGVVVWDISVATSRLVQPQRELVRQLPDSHDYRLSGAPIGPLALQIRECDLLWPGSPMKFLSMVWFYC